MFVLIIINSFVFVNKINNTKLTKKYFELICSNIYVDYFRKF